MSIKGVHHVGILVADLKGAERFFTETLGLRASESFDLDDGQLLRFYEGGACKIEIWSHTDSAVLEDRLGGKPASLDHIGIEVDDLGGTARALEGRGVELLPVSNGRLGPSQKSDLASTVGVLLQFLELNRPPDGDPS